MKLIDTVDYGLWSRVLNKMAQIDKLPCFLEFIVINALFGD